MKWRHNIVQCTGISGYVNIMWWWLIGSAPDFCGRGPWFESVISHNYPDLMRCRIIMNNVENLRVARETGNLPLGQKKRLK